MLTWYWWECLGLSISLLLSMVTAGYSEPLPSPTPSNSTPADYLDLNPEVIKNSPVLQRWQRQVPNVLEEIKNDPSFSTLVRFGSAPFPSAHQVGGWSIGIEDQFIGRTGLTVGGDYQISVHGDRHSGGADLRYYLRPLGSYINIAPVLGYRYLETDHYSSSGLNSGVRVLFVLSRGGAADIAFTQSWITPTTNTEVSLTTLSIGYAFTHNLRISTDLQAQNARENHDHRVGIALEWIP